MMAIDVKRLNSGDRVWLDRDGKPYPIPQKALMGEQRRDMEERLLAAATVDVEGIKRWYAFRTSHRGELAIRDALVKNGVDAVVPEKEIEATRRAGGRGRRVIHKPVLEGLVFVRMVYSDEAISGLLHVRGIGAVIGVRSHPHPIGDREMNGFMHLAQKGAFDERVMPGGVKVGQRVRISEGPFAEFEGVVEGYARSRHVRVLAHLFGQAVRMELTLANLQRID